jgi:hypothetical protein
MEERKKRIGMLEEQEGVLSSKRVLGVILLTAGGLFLLYVGIAALRLTVKDPDTALAVGKTLLFTGAGLLGVGVLEGIPAALGGRK